MSNTKDLRERYLNVSQTAEKLGLTEGRIRQMLRAKELPGIKVTERAWLIASQDVEKLAAQRNL